MMKAQMIRMVKQRLQHAEQQGSYSTIGSIVMLAAMEMSRQIAP